MMLRDILRCKGSDVYSTIVDDSLARVVEMMVNYNCGSMVVVESQDATQLVGIITERDILRVCASGKKLDETKVGDVMTHEVHTGETKTRVAHIMGLMTENRIRHLPVVDDDSLVGIISIGDVVKAQHDALSAENHALKEYIQS